MPQGLSKPTPEVISRRIKRHVLLAVGAGFLAAYGLLLIVATIAKEILE